MKKITVFRAIGGAVTIEAPKDKEMAYDAGLMQHGVLAIGEYGPSGVKIAAFNDWSYVNFEAPEYKVTVANPKEAGSGRK